MSRKLFEKLSKEEFINIVNQSINMNDLMIKLGYTHNSGSSRNTVYKYIIENNIDISHFKTTYKSSRYTLEEIFKENSTYTNIYQLKEKIKKYDLIEYRCAVCGNTGIWNNKKLILELDHIDGNNTNHSLKNLRFLCPNCHSQTKTFSKSK